MRTSYLLLLDNNPYILADIGGVHMTTITISIPEPLKQFLSKQMKKKGFGNVSEYFRSLLRSAKEQEDETRLEALLIEGLDSGKGTQLSRKFWKDLKTEAQHLLKKRQKSPTK